MSKAIAYPSAVLFLLGPFPIRPSSLFAFLCESWPIVLLVNQQQQQQQQQEGEEQVYFKYKNKKVMQNESNCTPEAAARGCLPFAGHTREWGGYGMVDS
jgi:flagellar biosynthesis component FlhA